MINNSKSQSENGADVPDIAKTFIPTFCRNTCTRKQSSKAVTLFNIFDFYLNSVLLPFFRCLLVYWIIDKLNLPSFFYGSMMNIWSKEILKINPNKCKQLSDRKKD